MVKYRNEFGEIRRSRRSLISAPVLRDLEALKIYPDEPVDSVIKRLLQTMNPEDMTQAIFKRLEGINAKMRADWNANLRKKYRMVHRRNQGDKQWVQKLYDEALKNTE